MKDIEDLVKKFPLVSGLSGAAISEGERSIFRIGKTILKVANGWGGIEANLAELAGWLASSEADKSFLCPIVGAEIVNNKLIIEMPYCTTPVTLKQLHESALYSQLARDTDAASALVFKYEGEKINVTDIGVDENSLINNLGILEDGRLVIIDYGESETADFINRRDKANEWCIEPDLF